MRIKLTLSEYIALTWAVLNNGKLEGLDNPIKARVLRDKFYSLRNKGVVDFTKLQVHRIFKCRFGGIYDLVLENFQLKGKLIYADNKGAIFEVDNKNEE